MGEIANITVPRMCMKRRPIMNGGLIIYVIGLPTGFALAVSGDLLVITHPYLLIKW